MKTILCYGDSNTWGFDPATGQRYHRATRWPGVLQASLGSEYEVIAEGMCGRTTVFDDPVVEGRNGRTYLSPCLASHKPIDLVVIMLGTNDLKYMFGVGAFEVASGAGALVDIVRRSEAGPDGGSPGVLLVCPAPIASLETSQYKEGFREAREKSRQLAPHFEAIAAEKGCGFLDAGTVIESSPIDGIHLEAAAHRALGQAVSDWIAGTAASQRPD